MNMGIKRKMNKIKIAYFRIWGIKRFQFGYTTRWNLNRINAYKGVK
jgi:hypothetical protein